MSKKTFEASLMDMISQSFVKEGAEWELVKAGEDGCNLPINHTVHFVNGKFFYISLIEFIMKDQILGDRTLSYTIRVTDKEPETIDSVLSTGNILIEITWNQSDEFYLSRYGFSSCGHDSLRGESFDFLISIFSRLVNFTPSQ